MTPGAHIQSTLELLDTLWSGSTPPKQLLNNWFRKRRYVGSSDRRAIKGHFYTVLRHRARLDWWINRYMRGDIPSARTRLIAYLILKVRVNPDVICNYFSGAQYCPPELNYNEKRLVISLSGKGLHHIDMPTHVAFEFPAWMERSLYALWGETLHEELTALNIPAPVDIRVNTLKSTRHQVKRLLESASIITHETKYSSVGLRLRTNSRLTETNTFKNGLIEIQDEGSQLIALLCDAKPGMNVLDFCAGAGGKTIALAATMGRGGKTIGRLTACDISKTRLDRLHTRLKRAGVSGVKCHSFNPYEDNWITEHVGTFERVLVDVPCTGVGTWRRNPNMKWQLRENDLKVLIHKQRSILRDAATMLKVGGKLIYSTCSLLIEENENQVEWFLKNHNDFQPDCINKTWAETICAKRPTNSKFLRLSPATTETDGYFCARLIKNH